MQWRAMFLNDLTLYLNPKVHLHLNEVEEWLWMVFQEAERNQSSLRKIAKHLIQNMQYTGQLKYASVKYKLDSVSLS